VRADPNVASSRARHVLATGFVRRDAVPRLRGNFRCARDLSPRREPERSAKRSRHRDTPTLGCSHENALRDSDAGGVSVANVEAVRAICNSGRNWEHAQICGYERVRPARALACRPILKSEIRPFRTAAHESRRLQICRQVPCLVALMDRVDVRAEQREGSYAIGGRSPRARSRRCRRHGRDHASREKETQQCNGAAGSFARHAFHCSRTAYNSRALQRARPYSRGARAYVRTDSIISRPRERSCRSITSGGSTRSVCSPAVSNRIPASQPRRTICIAGSTTSSPHI
jgi:hypothetical protein